MKEHIQNGTGFKAAISAPSLKAVLRVIASVDDEAILAVDPGGISIQMVDVANASAVDMKLEMSAFTEFVADHCFGLEIDIDTLTRMVMVADNLDTVLLERSSDEKNLIISFGYFRYELGLLEGLRKRKSPLPTIPDTASVSIPGREFVRMVAAAEVISDHARIGVCTDGEFFMEAVGVAGVPKRTNKVSMIIPAQGERSRVSLYSIEYLQALAEAVNYDRAIVLEIGADRPLLAVFEACGGCKVRYVLAPRIESDRGCETMEQKQDEPGTIWKIGRIVKEWQAERMGSGYAMREIETVLDAAEKREERLRTISEDARKTRELVDGGE